MQLMLPGAPAQRRREQRQRGQHLGGAWRCLWVMGRVGREQLRGDRGARPECEENTGTTLEHRHEFWGGFEKKKWDYHQ